MFPEWENWITSVKTARPANVSKNMFPRFASLFKRIAKDQRQKKSADKFSFDGLTKVNQ